MTIICSKSLAQETLIDQATIDERKRLEMWEEPRHQLVFSQDSMRIMDIRIPPGDTSDFHLHRYATIYVVINSTSTGQQVYGHEWTRPLPSITPRNRRLSKGNIFDLSEQYVSKELYHRVCNSDTSTFHLIGILSVKTPKEFEKGVFQDFENPWFSAKRLIIEAKKESPLLQFSNEILVIQYTQGSSDIIENNVVHSRKTQAGNFSWHNVNTAFRIRNNSKNNLGLILIQIK